MVGLHFSETPCVIYTIFVATSSSFSILWTHAPHAGPHKISSTEVSSTAISKEL